MTQNDLKSLYGVKMSGIGAYAPESVVTNDDLTQLVETSDEWIRTRTGIEERRVVKGDESIADLAIPAAEEALKSAGMSGEDIDLIIVASSTPDTIYPASACQVQSAIGAKNAAGFDMALACSGFVYGCVIAQQFIRTGMIKNALIIGADIHSRYTNWHDRNTCILFGDAAGAAILSRDESKDRFMASDIHLNGDKGMELTLFTPAENCPLVEPRSPVNHFVYMNGREVFKFAVGVVPKSIQNVLDDSGLEVGDLDKVVLHQANIRIMEAMSEKLNLPPEKMVINLQKYGNTSAASVPLALNEAVLKGEVTPGDKVLMCGFGAGLAWGTTIFEWTCVDQRLSPEKQEEVRKKSKLEEPVGV